MKKLFIGIIALFLILQVSGQAAAATKLPYFYKGGAVEGCPEYMYCDSGLLTAPNGRIYQFDNTAQKVTAIDPNGKKLWTYAFPKDSMFTYPSDTVAFDQKGNVYISYMADGSYLASISINGKLNWKFKLDSRWGLGAGKPLISSNGTVYFGSGNMTEMYGPFRDSFFYAVSSAGKKLWSKKLSGDGLFSGTAFDSKKNLVIRTTDDKNTWRYVISTKGSIISNKTTDAYHSSFDKAYNEYSINYKTNYLTAVDKNGKNLWKYKTPDYTRLSYVSTDGTVFVQGDKSIFAIAKGKLIWKATAGDMKYEKEGVYSFNWNRDNGTIDVKVLDPKTGKVKYSASKVQLDTYQFTIHSKGAVLFSKGRDIFKLSLFPEKSDPLKASQVLITNNKKESDTVKVSSIKKGDTIKVYNTSAKVIGSKKSTSTSVTISISQLGKAAGKVYVTITNPSKRESDKVTVSYKAEK